MFTDARDTADQRDAGVPRRRRRCGRSNTRSAARNTIITPPDGDDLPAHGRFWINPSNGSVLISELIVDGGGVIATVTVSYQSEPLMGFLVPVEMRESYVRYGERITGHAEYEVPARSGNRLAIHVSTGRAGLSGTEAYAFLSALLFAGAIVTAAPLPADLQAIKITATGTLTPQYALVHLYAEKGFKGYALVDSAGRIAWHYRTKDYPFGADRRKNGNFVFMDKGHGLVEVDRTGAIVHELKQRDPEERNASRDRRDAARHGAVSRVRHAGLRRQAAEGRSDLGMESRHRRGREALAIVGLHGSRARSIGAHRRRVAARQLAVTSDRAATSCSVFTTSTR